MTLQAGLLIAGALTDIAGRAKFGTASAGDVARRFFGLPRSAHGTWLAHLGVGLMVIGIVATSAWREESVLAMKPGDTAEIAGYQLTFKGVQEQPGPNYEERAGIFEVRQGGNLETILNPAKRTFPAERQSTTEAGILATFAGDLYCVLGDEIDGGGYSVRLYFNPFVRFIWIGALVMFFAGAMSLSDRRLRVGAPRKVKAAKLAAAT